MNQIKVGDIVARKSYASDILFKVVDIREGDNGKIYILKGLYYRIQADSPESDLEVPDESRIHSDNTRMRAMAEKKSRDILTQRRVGVKKKYFRHPYVMRSTSRDTANEQQFSLPGRVLHVDGDKDYLETCLEEYKNFGIEAVGIHIPEKDQPSQIYKLLQEHAPDILVLTGHDGLIKGDKSYVNTDNYRNSKHYIEATREARRYDRDKDTLVIFAGACQSFYKEIIKAGANYASSPNRVLIHALDPVFICQKIAFTSFQKIIPPSEIINTTITGKDGIGGVETRGKYRHGFPLDSY